MLTCVAAAVSHTVVVSTPLKSVMPALHFAAVPRVNVQLAGSVPVTTW